MRVNDTYDNISNTQSGRGMRLIGWTHTQRIFRVRMSNRRRDMQPGWLATAITPRDDVVTELRGPTLQSISDQLAALEA